MASESILTNRSDCSTENGSTRDNNNNSGNETNLFSCTKARENDTRPRLFEVHGIGHQQDSNILRCRFNKKSKFQATRLKTTSLSKEEKILCATTNEAVISYSSKVWQYAIRCPNSNYSTCCLCPDNKKISTHNGSTSTLRKHLITKHNIHEVALPNEKRKSIKPSISIQRKQELHTLCIYCIIKDGRTFNDLHKPGMKKLLQSLIPGRFI